MTPATVSHHLKILAETGLIECRREGQFVYSEGNTKRLQDLRVLAALSRKRKKRAKA